MEIINNDYHRATFILCRGCVPQLDITCTAPLELSDCYPYISKDPADNGKQICQIIECYRMNGWDAFDILSDYGKEYDRMGHPFQRLSVDLAVKYKAIGGLDDYEDWFGLEVIEDE